MKINLLTLFKKREIDYTEMYIQIYLKNLNYSRRKLKQFFTFILDEAKKKMIKNRAQLKFFDLTPALNAILFSSVIRDYELKDLLTLIKTYGYVNPPLLRHGYDIYQLKNKTIILHSEVSDVSDPFGTDTNMTDVFIHLITNDLALLKAISQHKFTMTPPWLIFSDITFGHRHGPWRQDWQYFWESLSYEEKKEYLVINPPQEKWDKWLFNGYNPDV